MTKYLMRLRSILFLITRHLVLQNTHFFFTFPVSFSSSPKQNEQTAKQAIWFWFILFCHFGNHKSSFRLCNISFDCVKRLFGIYALAMGPSSIFLLFFWYRYYNFRFVSSFCRYSFFFCPHSHFFTNVRISGIFVFVMALVLDYMKSMVNGTSQFLMCSVTQTKANTNIFCD